MKKSIAMALLGGTERGVGKRIGCSGQAVHGWPDVLPRRIVDRVVAAVVRELVFAERAEPRRPGQITLPPDLYRYLRSHAAPPKVAEDSADGTGNSGYVA